MTKQSIFDKHPKTTLFVFISIILSALLIGLELVSQKAGLGSPVLYQSHPVYGYRPLPNQTQTRFNNAKIHLNNLGLRANEDWDESNQNKVLFLGDSITYGGSYIDNEQLFSTLALKDTAFQSGNAGVNGWGVLNVHALIHDYHFLPATVYVSVFPEGDFYRGLNRFGGQPYWTRPPKWALKELFYYWLYKVNLKKYGGFSTASLSENDLSVTVDLAVSKLKEMDQFLAEQGKQHTIFITPSRSQCLGNQEKDKRILEAMTKHNLNAIYLIDELPVGKSDIESWYHDEIHLSVLGHQVWGKYIGQHLSSIEKDRPNLPQSS